MPGFWRWPCSIGPSMPAQVSEGAPHGFKSAVEKGRLTISAAT